MQPRMKNCYEVLFKRSSGNLCMIHFLLIFEVVPVYAQQRYLQYVDYRYIRTIISEQQ